MFSFLREHNIEEDVITLMENDQVIPSILKLYNYKYTITCNIARLLILGCLAFVFQKYF